MILVGQSVDMSEVEFIIEEDSNLAQVTIEVNRYGVETKKLAGAGDTRRLFTTGKTMRDS